MGEINLVKFCFRVRQQGKPQIFLTILLNFADDIFPFNLNRCPFNSG